MIQKLYGAARQAARALSARRALARFVPPYKLHLGCGSIRFDGWVNLDAEPLPTVDAVWDLRRGLPFEDCSCELVFSEHVLEHFTCADGGALLRECRRVLRPGGVVRIAMPSLDFILERAVSSDWRAQDWLTWPAYQQISTRAEMLNVAFRDWGHRYLYDREELHRRLAEAGFTTVVDVEHGQSELAELRGRESRPDSRLICEAKR